MAIPDEEVALVRQATDMVALVSEYLALRKAGRRWVGICPFHQEKTPSFNVNAEDGLFHCFGCHASGDAITFLREVEHLDFVEAVERLASRAHITLHETSNPADAARRKKRDDLLEVVQAAVDFYHQSLQNSDAAQHARDYLAERGYGASTIAMFRLGWSPDDWDVVAKELKFDNKLLVEAGIGFVNKRGRFQDAMRGRLIFPIFDSAGRSVAMGGRIIPGHAPSGDTDAPKYKNSPETSIYSKRRTLYGLNWAKAEVASTNQIVVCEGYTDVIGCHLAGVPNVVATCGTALAEEHFAILRKFARRVILAYDADGAGAAGAERVYGWERSHDVDVAVAALPAGSDPGSLASEDPAKLAECISRAQPFLGFRVTRILAKADLGSGEGRARAAEDALNVIAEHPNEMVRDQYVVLVAERTRIEPDRARKLLAGVIAANRRKAPPPGGRGAQAGLGSPARSGQRSVPTSASRVAPATGPRVAPASGSRVAPASGTSGASGSSGSSGTPSASNIASVPVGPSKENGSSPAKAVAARASQNGPPASPATSSAEGRSIPNFDEGDLSPSKSLESPDTANTPEVDSVGSAPSGATGANFSKEIQSLPGRPAELEKIDKLESEALRVLIVEPDAIAPMLDEVLFSVEPMRLCFRALLDAEFDLHRAIAASDPQTAGLLAQFAVEEPSVMPNEAWRRMIERASVRSVHDIEIVIRENPERFAELEPLKGAIKVAIEDLRDTRDNERSGGAAEALLGWLIEHASGETEYAVPATNTVQGMK